MKKKSKQKLFKSKLGDRRLIVTMAIVVFAVGGILMLRSSNAGSCTSHVYRQGSRGTCVRNIQTLVNYNLYSLNSSRYISTDGIFGRQTKSTIVAFQRSRGLSQDGIVGRNTWRELCNPYKGPQPGWWLTAARNAGC